MGWSYEWTKNLSLTSNFDVFPIQFANTKRIEYNDAVYIFDEVGCGKTISAGLMALNYLWNCKRKGVQIITINSLVRPVPNSSYGQFLNDWFEKLPFQSLELEKHIAICNNHYKNIEKVSECDSVGLLIIDEAHLFLEDTLRLRELKKIHAEKVIFLTATPIKDIAQRNIFQYLEIANAVLGKKNEGMGGEKLFSLYNLTSGTMPLCSQFDLYCPVTRYFKDTVTALEYVDNGVIDFKKQKVKRLIPQIWNFNTQKSKINCLVSGILSRLFDKAGRKNRFVIFTRYIERESELIMAELLKREEFTEWDGTRNESKLSVVNINGQTEERATSYSHNGLKKDLPDIILITYQIAEQGINLPGYNYVINFHIPAFPSSLEQRFGRIDRMGKKNPSQYEEINMVFLLSESGWETYKLNFYSAVYIYRNNLITKIPAKNVLLTKEILSRYKDDAEVVKNYISELECSLEDGGKLGRAWTYLQNCLVKDATQQERNPETEKEVRNEDPYSDDELIQFCVENDIFIEIDETIEDLRQLIKNTISEFKYIFTSKNGDTDDAKIIEILGKIGDKIYYFEGDDTNKLVTIDAIDDCAEQIYKSDVYKCYEKEFNENIKFPKIVEKWQDQLESFFENMFISGNGNFEKIFLVKSDYKKLFMEDVINGKNWDGISDYEKKVLCENADTVVFNLPFFKMVQSYKKIIYEYLFTREGYERIKYDFDLLLSSYYALKRTGYIPERILQNTERNGQGNSIFYTASNEEDYECSQWFKLFYICMDKNALTYLRFANEFKRIAKSADEMWMELQNEYYRAENIAYDGEDNSVEAEAIKYELLRDMDLPIYDTLEKMVLEEYKDKLDKLLKMIESVQNNKNYYVNFFHIFFAEQGGKTGKWRKPYWPKYWTTNNWSDLLPTQSSGRGWCQIWSLKNYQKCDFWTYMIFNEIGWGAADEYRTGSKEWWINHFIPERCSCQFESKTIVKEYINKHI